MAVENAGSDEVDAYERLLTDAMKGDATLFVREDAVEAAWVVVERSSTTPRRSIPTRRDPGARRRRTASRRTSRAGTTRRRTREAAGETAEGRRLADNDRRVAHWNRWGPYLSERAWGTVREDYSRDGTAWDYFPHDHARSRAYRWNEDGLLGICDRHQRICFALALWNGNDPILKERLFGLTNSEGNHGEDVKECWFYLDATPTHSYLKALYKYPQAEYPYAQLLAENRRRGTTSPSTSCSTPASSTRPLLRRVRRVRQGDVRRHPRSRSRSFNRGPEAATLDLLPTIWYRNTWSWDGDRRRPLAADGATGGPPSSSRIRYLGRRYLHADPDAELLFTENETNIERLFRAPNASPYVKDAFHAYLVEGRRDAVNPARRGTKAAAWTRLAVPAGGSARVRLRLTERRCEKAIRSARTSTRAIDRCRARGRRVLRRHDPGVAAEDERRVMRQALAGMIWSKQYYGYDVRRWLLGDPAEPPPPPERRRGRNRDWRTSTPPTCSRCRTPGSSRGSPPGTSPSTASSSR